MKPSPRLVALAVSLVVGIAGAARAGAPAPDQRQADFAHVCAGGPNDDLPCTVETQGADCPGSTCVPATSGGKPINGTLTIIAHDAVTDWLNGGATHRALTLLLEVKGPDRSKQMLAATYQNLASPTDPPAAPGDVVAIPLDESAVASLAADVNGLLFARPEATLAQQLQTLFGTTDTPAIVAAQSRKAESADHTGDDLATVLRFKVKLQFLGLE